MPGLLQYSKVSRSRPRFGSRVFGDETDGNAGSRKVRSMQPGLAGTAALLEVLGHELPENGRDRPYLFGALRIKGMLFFTAL